MWYGLCVCMLLSVVLYKIFCGYTYVFLWETEPQRQLLKILLSYLPSTSVIYEKRILSELNHLFAVQDIPFFILTSLLFQKEFVDCLLLIVTGCQR
jgi:hypothetical protein